MFVRVRYSRSGIPSKWLLRPLVVQVITGGRGIKVAPSTPCTFKLLRSLVYYLISLDLVLLFFLHCPADREGEATIAVAVFGDQTGLCRLLCFAYPKEACHRRGKTVTNKNIHIALGRRPKRLVSKLPFAVIETKFKRDDDCYEPILPPALLLPL